jgi:proteic killer suppression protein
MRVDFEDDDLRKLHEETDFRAPGLGPELTRSFGKVLNFIVSSKDERDLRSMGSLHFEKLKGKRAGEHSLQLHGGSRLICRLDGTGDQKTLVVLEITDYH